MATSAGLPVMLEAFLAFGVAGAREREVRVKQRQAVAEQLRDGNVPGGMGNAEFGRTALAALPSEIGERHVCCDTVLPDHRPMRAQDRGSEGFAIRAALPRPGHQAAAPPAPLPRSASDSGVPPRA